MPTGIGREKKPKMEVQHLKTPSEMVDNWEEVVYRNRAKRTVEKERERSGQCEVE